MRLIDFINQEYLNEIKKDLILSKQFIPESVRSFLTFDEIRASFDESLRPRYSQEKMEFRLEMSSIYISIDLLNFLKENNYWGLITDKSSFLKFLKEIIKDDFDYYHKGFSEDERKKYDEDYSRFLTIYESCI